MKFICKFSSENFTVNAKFDFFYLNLGFYPVTTPELYFFSPFKNRLELQVT